jgi:DNA repair exonuclease SbcCD ATPase subunit
MIIIGSIHIIGFGSIKEVKLEFNNEGMYIIKGKNGAGKTTIFSALFWCLFGETLKPKSTITTWETHQWEDYPGTMVNVRLGKGAELINITRCLDYKEKIYGGKGANRLIVEKNLKVLDIKDKRDIQKEIESIMGMSSTLFKSSIIFGQKMKRLIEDTGGDKKKILEEAFNVNFINEAIKNVENDSRKIKDTYSEAEVKFIKLENQQKELISQQAWANTKYELALEKYNNQKVNLENEIKNLKEKQSNTDSLLDKKVILKANIGTLKKKCHPRDIKLLHKKAAKLGKKTISLGNDIRDKKKELLQLVNHPKVCPTCKRPSEMGFSETREINIHVFNNSISYLEVELNVT